MGVPFRMARNDRSARLLSAVGLLLGLAATHSRDDTHSVADDGVIEVPGEADTIQEAVDAASPGDIVLISPGVYVEEVDVTTDDVTIRGLDRAGVVLDGEFELTNGLRILGAQGVVVENLTVQNYMVNGIFWTGVDGFRGSYLTSLRNQEYGLYAYDSTHGQLDHSYAAGSGDGGFYVGQCYPCFVVLDDVLAEHNGIGYAGADSGGDLLIVNSTFRSNRVGMLMGSHTYELCYPQRETTVVGNLVYSNNESDTAAVDTALLAMGNGIVSAGGIRNTIERNRVWDHNRTGIGIVLWLEDTPTDVMPGPGDWDRPCAETRDQMPATSLPAVNVWEPFENTVVGNVLDDNRVADIALASPTAELPAFGNCFADNTFVISAPAELEALAPCDGEPVDGDWADGALDVVSWLAEVDSMPPPVPSEDVELPELPDLPDMRDPATAVADPARELPAPVDVDAILVPDTPGE